MSDDMDELLRRVAVNTTIADTTANKIAKFLVGRLRVVDSYWLIILKRELSDFNAHTKRWKS